MNGDEKNDELSEAEFKLFEKQHDEVLNELYKVVQAKDEATTFLNTEFGKSLRKSLVANKLKAMKQCATCKSLDPETLFANRLAFEVICKVEAIFGHIIVDGTEALRQLEINLGDNNDNENFKE